MGYEHLGLTPKLRRFECCVVIRFQNELPVLVFE
jgi:hypothetical protein